MVGAGVGDKAMAKQRVVVAGYYGFGNLGDEVLLQVVLRWLSQYPQVEPWVLSGDPDQTRRHHRVSAVNRASILGVVYSLVRARALIFGGGGLLQDATSRRSLWYYLGLLRLARWFKVPVMLIGQGLGPLSARGEYRVAQALQRVAYVSVRDEHSLRLLQRWKVAHAQLGPDLAFCLSAPPPAQDRQVVPLLGVALVSPPENAYEAVLRRMAGAIEAAQQELGLTPIFLAANPRDLKFGIALNRKVPALTVLSLAQDAAENHQALFSGFKVIWGSRLHALILAAQAGVPFAALGYDPKVEQFVAQLNRTLHAALPYWMLKDVDAAELVRATGALLGAPGLEAELQAAAGEFHAQATQGLADAGLKLEQLLGLQAPQAGAKV